MKNKSEIKKMFDAHQANLVPSVKDEKGGWDLFSKMLDARIVRVDGQVDDGQAAIVSASLEYLDHVGKNLPESDRVIEMRINSPGGSVYAGLAMYDMMRTIESPIRTVCYGMAASMGSLLLVAGDERYASPNALIMIHQPLGGTGGSTQATDMEISNDSIQRCKEDLIQIYVDHTGVPHEIWDDLLDRDNYLSSAQAKEIGLIDDIIPHKKPAPYAGIKRSAKAPTFNESSSDVAAKAKKLRENAVQAKVTNDNKAVAKPAAKAPKQG